MNTHINFTIDYNSMPKYRKVFYDFEELSFDTEPFESKIDFDFAINNLTFSVVDHKIVAVSGFCALNKQMRFPIIAPDFIKGGLNVNCDVEGGFGVLDITDEEWPVYVSDKTGWICIGNYEKKGQAVEVINNCIFVIDKAKRVTSVWFKVDKDALIKCFS